MRKLEPEACIELFPTKQIYVSDNDVFFIENGIKIQLTNDQKLLVSNKVLEYENEYKKNQYQRNRLIEYNKLNQLELMYDDLINGTTTWQDAIQSIKEKYPKPE